MHRSVILRFTFAAALAFAGFGVAQEPAPDGGPGWTGVAHPHDVIAARQALMAEIERFMRPIDSYSAGEPIDPEEVRAAAETISTMLLATPHLFPPPTNLYDEKAESPATLALPTVWESFSTFYSLAGAAADAATTVASTSEETALRGAASALRASCDTCHAVYLRPYVPAGVSSEDLEFDFDSIFE